MNGRLAKRIRKQIYGPEGSARFREYLMRSPPKGYRLGMSEAEIMNLIRQNGPGPIVADKKRQMYQYTKKVIGEGLRG